MVLVLFFLLGVGLNAQEANSGRVALVIGVQNYSKIPKLRHSLNDAQDISSILKSKGFQVESLYDPKSRVEIREAIIRYYNKMKDKTGAVGIIYYAGHGVQNEAKENYIIPADAEILLPSDLDNQCVKMNTVMSVLNSSSNLNILLLDACRTNSLPSFGRDVAQGLSKESAPQGSIVVFATQPGKVASDGSGRNGLFTSKLLKNINEPGLNIGEVFRKVKQDVFVESINAQLPSLEDNSFGSDFYFTKGESQGNAAEVKMPVAKTELFAAIFDYGYGPSDAGTVIIGSQTWILKNLNVNTFSNGDPIPEARSIEDWKSATENGNPAWCYYLNDPFYGVKYGKLYNWYAVHDARGLAPKGWHVPSDAEWSLAANNRGGEDFAGAQLKSATGWDNNWNGTNSSGFTGLPGGFRSSDFLGSGFVEAGKQGRFWSSTEVNAKEAWSWIMSNGSKVNRGNWDKGLGLSVRCIKD